MTDLQKDTEAKILEAAREEFLQKGMAGARMQAIADKAGINKALLHYYFRSKEKLFEGVFRSIFNNFFPKVFSMLSSEELDIFQKIEQFIHNYIDFLRDNPRVPLFIIAELTRNPDKLVDTMKSTDINPMPFAMQLGAAVQAGKIKPIDPRHLIVNILSLCVFPIAAKPVMENIIFQGDGTAYQGFLEERKEHVSKLIIESIKPKKD